MSIQIKSRKRVKDLVEILTAKREVESITDLIKDLSEKIDSKFFEPSCGNGNFLCEILNRRINRLKKTYKKKMDFEFYLIKASASLYGIDIDKNNIKEAKDRMYDIIKLCSNHIENKIVMKIIKKILDTNIVVGNTIKDEIDLFTSGNDIIFINYTSPKMFYFKKLYHRFNDLKSNVKKPIKVDKILYYLDL